MLWTSLIISAEKGNKAGFLFIALWPDLALDLGVGESQQGVAVSGVLSGSPAEKAGIRDGDVIFQIQNPKGKLTEVKDEQSFISALKSISSSKPVVFKILRGKEEISISLVRTPGDFELSVQPVQLETPATIKVMPDGSGDFRTLAGAMIHARPRDTILAGAGNYPCLHIIRDDIIVNSLDPEHAAVLKGVILQGIKEAKLKGISFVSPETGSYTGISGNGNDITVENCIISGFRNGIDIGGSNLNITGNIIQGNANWAILVGQTVSSITVSHNLITRNSSGIRIETNGSFDIINNTIIENGVPSGQFFDKMLNEGTSGVGIAVLPNSAGTVINNIVAFNNIGFWIEPGSRVTLEYNNVFQHFIEERTKTSGLLGQYWTKIVASPSNYLSNISYKTVDYNTAYRPECSFQPSATNISTGPLFVDPTNGDYRLSADSPLVDRGRGGKYIGAFPPATSEQEADPQSMKPSFGIAARPLTESDIKTAGFSSPEGLWVLGVKQGSIADRLRIKADDIILEVNGTVFKNNDEFKKLISESAVTEVKVFRSGKTIILTSEIEEF